jgi:hypothetical protein
MPKYNLCVIDDKIPVEQFFNKIEVDNTGIIDQNILLNYIKFAEETAWSDTNLCELIKCLKEQVDIALYISAFITHSFYLNYINEHLFSPDIIIYDWDVGTSDMLPEESLKIILGKTYCLIAIYTGCDKIDEIKDIVQGEKLKPFEDRLFIIDKNEENSAELVISRLKKHLDDFSYNKYGRDFKYYINAAINTAFTKIGGLSFKQFIKLFGEPEGNKYKISSLDFINIMTEQIKAHLISSRKIESLIESEPSDDIFAEKQLWFFRMFHEPQDDIVRKGDIVWHKKNKKYYFIISSDCHLNDFWKKNLGLLVVVPLYKASDQSLTEKLKKSLKSKTLDSFQLTSLVNPQGVTSITILPFMDKKEDYIVMLKEVETFDIGNPTDNTSILPLKYITMPDFDGTNRFRLNEPFLSALIERVLRSITDIGVPDYSKQIKSILEKHITKLGSDETS